MPRKAKTSYQNKKYAIKVKVAAFKLQKRLGFLPTKPVERVVGKHEYIRIENPKRAYPKELYAESELSETLNTIKASGNKVLDYWYEWDGWTIKTMVAK